MPRVTVKMFATVREASGADSVQVEAESLSDLLDSLSVKFGKPFEEIAGGRALEDDRIIVLINGRNPGKSLARLVALADGDEIALFPPVSGG